MDVDALTRAVEAGGLKAFLRVYRSDAVSKTKQIGCGGFAAVWSDVLHKRDAGDVPVAVKVAHAALSEAELSNFLSEARAALSVRGSHVCVLLCATVCDGRPALLLPLYESSAYDLVEMEYPNGLPLPLALVVLLKVGHLGPIAAFIHCFNVSVLSYK